MTRRMRRGILAALGGGGLVGVGRRGVPGGKEQARDGARDVERVSDGLVGLRAASGHDGDRVAVGGRPLDARDLLELAVLRRQPEPEPMERVHGQLVRGDRGEMAVCPLVLVCGEVADERPGRICLRRSWARRRCRRVGRGPGGRGGRRR